MSETKSFESVAKSYDNHTWIGRDGVKRAIDRLKAAHNREMEELRKTYDLALAQARDPQRLRGTKPDTFDGAIEALREFRWQHATNDEDAIPYINAVKEMHDREIRDVSQREFDLLGEHMILLAIVTVLLATLSFLFGIVLGRMGY